MNLIEQIKEAGIVGCGGAGFPTHVKLDCNVEYLIINGAECEPLLRTDRWLMKNKAQEIVTAAQKTAEVVGAQKCYIALKDSYREEIASLEEAIDVLRSSVSLFKMHNFYPAGDEQVMVCDVTGRTVPPSGIPLDVGAVVSNIATMYGIYQASNGIPFTNKYLSVTGEVLTPTVIEAPIGASFAECIEAAGGTLIENYSVISGGPLMGKLFTKEQGKSQVVTKTTSGIIIIPEEIPLVSQRETMLSAILRRAKTACIQCSSCTEMCPRFLTGHPLKPHKIMRKMAYAEDISNILDDFDIRQAQICSECGICETYACPMGVQPRRVNAYVKAELAKAGIRYQKQSEPLEQREEREWRRIPSKRIAMRLGVDKYYDYRIDSLQKLEVSSVKIPLKQHIGAPAEPNVKEGDSVSCGQVIGTYPEKGIGANIHASIDGVVVSVTDSVIIERRQG